MAVNNAQKQFNFAIELNGIDQFYIQSVKLPDVEVGSVSHGGDNFSVKTAGAVSVGDAELSKIMIAGGADPWANNWLQRAQNMNSGVGGTPDVYKETVVFKRLNSAGATVERFIWEGTWVKKISFSEFKRGDANENIMETITVSIDRVRRI